MFIHQQSQQIIHAIPGHSISTATHRPQDLLPAYLHVLRDTPEYVQITQTIPAHVYEDHQAIWWAEKAPYFIEMLTETLENYAPDGYSFGTLEGDGSDFGYWPTTEYECQNCGHQVTEIPAFDLDETQSKDLYQCSHCGWLQTEL